MVELRATAAAALRFGLAGAANTLVTGALLSVLAHFIDPSIAYAIVFVAGIALSTWLAGSFVFRTRLSRRDVVRYVVLYVAVFLVGLAALRIATGAGMPHEASGLVVLVTAPLTFLGAHVLIGRRTAEAGAGRHRVPEGDGPGRYWWDRREAWQAALAVATVCGLYLAVVASRGALGASRNDDWVYLRTTFHFAETGEFVADPWSLAMLVGLVAIAAPVIAIVGPHIAALQVLVVVLGGLGLWAAYLVVRAILPKGWAAFAVACLALGPIYGSVATTFMTDVPSFCLQMLALLAGMIAVRGERLSLPWLAVSLLAGLAAFSIREYSVAVVVAVVVAGAVRARSQGRRLVLTVAALGALWVLVAGALYLWRSGLVDAPPIAVDVVPGEANLTAVRMTLFTLALLVLPVVPLISVPRLARALGAHKVVALGAVVLGVLVVLAFRAVRPDGVLIGNYVSAYGAYSVTLGGAPPRVIPPTAWTLMGLAAFFSLAAVVVVAVTGLGAWVAPRARRTAPWMPQDPARTLILLYASAAGGVLVAIKLFTSAPIFDRYLVPLIPFVVALVVRSLRDRGLIVRRDRLVAGVSLGIFAVFGLAIVDNTATFDGVKWRLAEAVVQLGYPADAIDGGYEWYGLHQPTPIQNLAPVDRGRNFWIGLFDERPVCVTTQFAGSPPAFAPDAAPVVVSERSATSLLGVEYKLIAVAGPESCQPSTDGRQP